MRRLSALGEFGWLDRLLPKLYWPRELNSQLCIGAGDDAGVIRISPGKVLVSTTDAMVEGIHFERKWMNWHELGFKIMAVNLSDLAAMGDVRPLAALVTAGLPGDTPVDSVDKIYKGMNTCAQLWKTGFLGGDTVGSNKGIFLSVTLLGEARPRNLVQRRGARPGDLIATTGPLGLSGAGLEVLQAGKRSVGWTRPLVEAFSHPIPRFKEGALLGSRRLATSMLDSSDGLEASVKLLATASGLGAEIDLSRLPIPDSLSRWAYTRKRHPWDYALKGGEDYELIFTVRPTQLNKVRRYLPNVTVIGKMLSKGRNVWGVLPGRRFPLKGYGFSHFS